MKKRLFSLLLALLMTVALLPMQVFAYVGGITGSAVYHAVPVVTKLEGTNGGSQIWSMKLRNSGEGIEFYLAIDGPHAGKSVTSSARYHHQAYTMDSINLGVYEQARFTLQTGNSQKDLKLEKMEVIDPKTEPGFDNYFGYEVPAAGALTVRCTFSGYGRGDPEVMCYISYNIVRLGDGVTDGKLTVEADDPENSRTYAVVARAAWGPGGIATDNIPSFILRYFQDFRGFSRMGHARGETGSAHVLISRFTEQGHKSTDVTAGLGRTSLWAPRAGSGEITEVYSDSYGVDNPFVLAEWPTLNDANFGIDPTRFVSYDAKTDCLTAESRGATIGTGTAPYVRVMHAWGFRDVYGTNEGAVEDPKFTEPDKVTVPQNADRLGLYRAEGGVLAAPIPDSAREAALKAQYGEPLYTLRGDFEAKSDGAGKYYDFTTGMAALTSTITASWSGAGQYFRVRVDEAGLVTRFDTTSMVQYSTPRFRLFSAAQPTDPPAGLALEGETLALSMIPEKNAVLVFIDIPQVSSKIDKALLKPNGDLILSGEMGLDLILNCSPDKLLTLEALGYGPKKNADGTISFVQNGIKADGHLDTGALLGLELAEIEAHINTFAGEELYSFSLELNAFDLFETQAELELKRLNNGRLAPNNLYFSLAVEPGIPLVPPVPTAFLRGGGGGFYGLADTINGDFIGIPPIQLKLTAIGDYLKIVKGKVHITLGPSYLEYAGTDVTIAGADVLDSFNMYLRLTGEKRWYRNIEYTGLRAGGGMGVVIKAPQGDKAIFEVNSKVEASMFGGLNDYDRPTSAHLQIDSRGSIIARVMIPKKLGKLTFRIIGGRTLATASVDFILGAQTAVNVNPAAYAGMDAGQILSTAATSAWNNLSVYGGLSHMGNIALTHWRLYYILPNHVGGAFNLVKDINKGWSLEKEIDKNAWFVSGSRAQAFSAAPLSEDTYLCIDDETGEQIGIAVVEYSLAALPVAESETVSLLAARGPNGRYSETITGTPAYAGADQLLLQIFPKDDEDLETLRESLSITPEGGSPITLIDPVIDANGVFTNPETANCTEIEDEPEEGVARTGLLIATGLAANMPQTLTIEADCDFDYVLCASARPTTLDFSLRGYNASSSIANPRDGKTYAVRYYLDTHPDRSGENYFLDMVEGDGPYSLTVPSEGSLAPSGSYYVTAVLVERIVGDFNGDGTIGEDEYSWVTVDTATSTATIVYTNNVIPNAPTGVALSFTGNETLTASWEAPASGPAVDGYRVTLYYQDGTGWTQAGAPYVFSNADFSDPRIQAAAVNGGTYSLRMAPTVAGSNVSVNELTWQVSKTGGVSDAAPADRNYMVTVESVRYARDETTGEVLAENLNYYSNPARSGQAYLKPYTAPTLTVTTPGGQSVILNGQNGYDTLLWGEGDLPAVGTLFTVTGSGVDGLAVTADVGTGTFTADGTGGTWEVSGDDAALALIEQSGRVKLTVTAGEDSTDYYLRLSLDDVPPVLTLDEKNVRADTDTGAYTVTGQTEPGLDVTLSLTLADGQGQPLTLTAKADEQGRFAIAGVLPTGLEDGLNENGEDVQQQTGFRAQMGDVTAQDGAGNAAVPAPVIISARSASGPDPNPNPNPNPNPGPILPTGPAYDIVVPDTPGGTVTVSPSQAAAGVTVTVTAKPDAGYVLDTLQVVDQNGGEVRLTPRGGNAFTFIMPAGKVEIRARFVPQTAFVDVPADAWYAPAVAWAVEQGITTGTTPDTFSPDDPCTRGQIVTFLWRAAGRPEPKAAAAFTDVPADAYYAKAVAWAVEQGITLGTSSTTFSPDDPCTRGQAVTFLARALGALPQSRAVFTDVPAGSYYEDAVSWAAETGVTQGVGGGRFAPDDPCTRAQIVTFLYRAYHK